jgi:hypothetical protein
MVFACGTRAFKSAFLRGPAAGRAVVLAFSQEVIAAVVQASSLVAGVLSADNPRAWSLARSVARVIPSSREA